MKPHIHAQSSAKMFGGVPEDYEEIHTFMDSSKAAFPTNAHRALTHNSWFIFQILERIKFNNSCPATPDNRFPTIKNSQGNMVSVRDVAEQHILEDFRGKFIPSAADFLSEINFQPWMQNGEGDLPSWKNINNLKSPAKEASYDGSRMGVLGFPNDTTLLTPDARKSKIVD